MIDAAEAIDADALRIRHQFLSRPDLQASPASIASLLEISIRHAEQLLESLVREGFLRRRADGAYARPTETSVR